MEEAKVVKAEKTDTLMAFILTLCFFVVRTWVLILIIMDIIRWFEVPIVLTNKQLFGLIICIRLLVIPITGRKIPNQTEKQVIIESIMSILALLAAWGIFYVIYSLIFK